MADHPFEGFGKVLDIRHTHLLRNLCYREIGGLQEAYRGLNTVVKKVLVEGQPGVLPDQCADVVFVITESGPKLSGFQRAAVIAADILENNIRFLPVAAQVNGCSRRIIRIRISFNRALHRAS